MADRVQLDRWMAEAADGDRTAIAPLFHELWPIALGYATRFVSDRALAEDCAQDALVKMFGQIQRYERGRDALTWALTHVMWQCRTARRVISRRKELPGVEDVRIVDGAALALERELVREALATLGSLEPRDIDVLTAALTDDDELRATLAPATFRKRLERAVTRLRTSWRSRHGTL
jgi:RNA polymerase sigma-70 factor (ECF subfamily)